MYGYMLGVCVDIETEAGSEVLAGRVAAVVVVEERNRQDTVFVASETGVVLRTEEDIRI